jgi:hypothetical protein
MHERPDSLSLRLLVWLQANRSSAGHYNNSMYLDVVEAGLEITRGNGWAYVTANISAN